MSVTFYAKRPDGSPIVLDIEHPAHLNMASANARAFLLFLGVDPGDEPCGEITMPQARRAILRARATFDRRVSGFPREASDTQRPGEPRVIACGIDEGYFAMRLDTFERFLTAVADKGASFVYWA